VQGIIVLDTAAKADFVQFRDAGFDAYLVRPVRPQSLLTHVGVLPEQIETVPGPAKPEQALQLRTGKASLRVLLVEDNDINALLALTVLEKSGAHVTRARNGAEAVAKARNALSQDKGFDLVFMDIHMPDMDGVEAARRIRELYPEGARPGAERPPIVALTANAFAEDRAAYLAAGLDDYLAKPFEKSDLAALFARWSVEKSEADQDTGLGAA
jgi:CheY-like chemotaxis protein